MILLTTTVQAIYIQQVSLMTAAGGASNGVNTIVFTSSICIITLIDVYYTRKNFGIIHVRCASRPMHLINSCQYIS